MLTVKELLRILACNGVKAVHANRIAVAIQEQVGNISTPPAAAELVEWLDGLNPRQRYGWWYSAAFAVGGYRDLADLREHRPSYQAVQALLAHTHAKQPQLARIVAGIDTLVADSGGGGGGGSGGCGGGGGGGGLLGDDALHPLVHQHEPNNQQNQHPPQNVTKGRSTDLHAHVHAHGGVSNVASTPIKASLNNGSSISSSGNSNVRSHLSVPPAPALSHQQHTQTATAPPKQLLPSSTSTMVASSDAPGDAPALPLALPPLKQMQLLPVGKHAFLSYQWDVQPAVVEVKDLLTRKGVRCWMDIDGGMKSDIYDSMHVAFRFTQIWDFSRMEPYLLSYH
jgi:hypothetical protein